MNYKEFLKLNKLKTIIFLVTAIILNFIYFGRMSFYSCQLACEGSWLQCLDYTCFFIFFVIPFIVIILVAFIFAYFIDKKLKTKN